jgi:hypothetical protein
MVSRDIPKCIYRNNKTFAICNTCSAVNSRFCAKHKNMAKVIYEMFYDVLGRASEIGLECRSIYEIYKYVHNTDIEVDMKKLLFIEVMKKIPKAILHDIYSPYFDIVKVNKNVYERIYKLNENTSKFGEENALKLQQLMKQWFVRRMLVYDRATVINKEDIFTYDDIDEIEKNRLFIYTDVKGGVYAFDAVELTYFVDRCKKDEVTIYNPFTRQKMDARMLCRLEMFMKYNGLVKKSEYRWQTEGHAFTDLSFEIEKKGFYNSPDWFMKMDKKILLKVIKLFKDFSGSIKESSVYFLELRKDTFVYDFCKEGIRLFSECNDDLYILCCNFIKALAMYSRDFYMNLPEWLANTNTTSRISDYVNHEGYGRFNMYNGYNGYNGLNSDNFLLYYYVEYMQ